MILPVLVQVKLYKLLFIEGRSSTEAINEKKHTEHDDDHNYLYYNMFYHYKEKCLHEYHYFSINEVKIDNNFSGGINNCFHQ